MTKSLLNMQHIIPNLKRWDYSDIPGGGHKKIKGPTHMADGGHHLRKAPTLTDYREVSLPGFSNIMGITRVNVYTVQCHYNAVNFLQNPLKRHPIARPLGWGMGCLLWVHTDLYSASVTAVMYAISCHIGPSYNGTRLYIPNNNGGGAWGRGWGDKLKTYLYHNWCTL